MTVLKLAIAGAKAYHTPMTLRPLAIAALCLLPSCGIFSNEYSPEYMREDSPLDPPGMAAARAAQRAQRVKEGVFAPGASVEVQQGRAFLLDRNPDHSDEPNGRMVKSATAKIISCEGLYYYVELEDGKKGFLRESDLVSPVQLVPTDPMLIGGDLFPGVLPAGETPAPTGDIPLDDNQQLTTNADGRTVVLVGKKTDRGAEFEARKQELEQAADNAAPSDDDAGDPPPLPDSSVGH